MRKKILIAIFPLVLVLSACNVHIKGGCHCPRFNSIEKPANGNKMALVPGKSIKQ